MVQLALLSVCWQYRSNIDVFFYSFTWILITSFSGAVIIVQNANFGVLSSDIMFALFLLLGVASQLLLMNYNEPTID